MPVQHEDAYLESRVYSATPSELIQLLYETALDAVREAMQAGDASQLAMRARSISRASSCVMELAGSLNVEVGGELGARLAALYEYLLHELLEASAQRSGRSLENCEQVLAALAEGWSRAMEGMDLTHAAAVSHGSGQNAQPTEPAENGAHEPWMAAMSDDAFADDDLVSGRASWCA